MQRYIDLRSDTVTLPTENMRKAMATAPVGDDFFGDDPTVIELEKMAAQFMGKQAALFLPSGTMANQVAIMSHTTPGDEIIASSHCHIVHYEMGAAAKLSGVGYALVDREDHTLHGEDILRLIRPKEYYYPKTTLVCLENALSNGTVVPLHILQNAYSTAKNANIAVHLDGARIFNAALALGVNAKEIAACADSVMFCLSKGLCSPVGSMLCGSTEFIATARRNRKLIGGTMRQAGVLAACGIVSLTEIVPKLNGDHQNAKYLGEKLSELDGITAQPEKIQINMVFWQTTNPSFNSDNFVAYMLQNGIKVSGESEGVYRFVTNQNVSPQDVEYVITTIKYYLATLA